MSKKYNIPELLSPAGSERSIRAAVNAGADAVYFGGKSFNARMSADNIGDIELEKMIDYCHMRGVKAYITVNTIYKDSELPALLRFIEKAYCSGADALIVQDMGAAALISQYFPDIPMHASTQTTAHSLNDVLFLENNGFCRVVLARELMVSEISNINDNTEDCETEVFAHGALCFCYSGRCLLSSFIGGRSGNRGRCAQPCRMRYTLMQGQAPVKTGYLLSPKDLMSIHILDKLADTGIASIKIEGRMKNPEYVYQVTSAYRTQLDNMQNGSIGITEDIETDIAQVFNRGGFTEGYFENHSSFSMMSVKSPKSIGVYIGKVISYDDVLQKCKILVEKALNPGDGLEIWTKSIPHAGGGVTKRVEPGGVVVINIQGDYDIQSGDLVYRSFDKALSDKLAALSDEDTKKITVSCYCKAKIGEDFYVRLSYDGMKAEAFGDIVQQAVRQPIAPDKIKEQLAKTGNTTFSIKFAECDIDEDIFIGIAQINETRRNAAAILENKIIERYKMKPVNASVNTNTNINTNINISTDKSTPNIGTSYKKITVSVMNELQLNAAISAGAGKISRIYAELPQIFLKADFLNDVSKRCRDAGIEFYVALPSINKDNIKSLIPFLETTCIDGYLARTFGQLYELDKCLTEKGVCADYHFNISNRYALKFFEGYADNAALSPELNFEDIAFSDKKSEITIYGKQILMTTQQCLVGIYSENKPSQMFCKSRGNHNHDGGYCLKDKTGVCFPVITNCDNCTAYILNDRPIFMAGKMRDLNNTPVGFIRLSFTDETQEHVQTIISMFYNALRNEGNNEVSKYIEQMGETGLTYGHFYRGSL